jgi:hypothetical protein
MDNHWPIEFLREDRFFISTKIVAQLGRIAFLLENSDRLFIGNARKRRQYALEFADVALQYR